MKKRDAVTTMTIIYLVMISGLLLFGTVEALTAQNQSERLASTPAALINERNPSIVQEKISEKA